MADRETLLALAERVEMATEGSEELDLAVHAAAFDQIIGDRQTYTPWSRSLDAALSLVPEGRPWQVSADPEGIFTADLMIHDEDGWWFAADGPHAEAATPALALTAAALLARAAMEE